MDVLNLVAAAARGIEGLLDDVNVLPLANKLALKLSNLIVFFEGLHDSLQGVQVFFNTLDVVVDAVAFAAGESIAIALRYAKWKRQVSLDVEEDVALVGHSLLKGGDAEGGVGLVVGQSPTDVVCRSSEALEIQLVGIEFLLKGRQVGVSVVDWVSSDGEDERQQQEADQQGFIHD